LGENSEAEFESVELTNIVVRIVSGTAIIESTGVERAGPIYVKSGALSVSIDAPGLYRFSEGNAFVLDGELRTDESGHSIYKGWRIQASIGDQGAEYEEAKIQPEQRTLLEQWSQQRSQTIASVNSRSSETNSASNILTPSRAGSVLYPGIGGVVLPRSYGFGIVARITPFSFFQWYNGGYSFYQPLIPRPPLGFYPGFYFGRPPLFLGHPRPIVRPSPSFPRPPAVAVPGPGPIPSRPGRISRGRR
jgi:hypothetical protein